MEEKAMSSVSSFTCISCHVAFKSPEQQREHYKSDWHRYNLKRKVSDLPPVSAEDFEQKVNSQKHAIELSQQDKTAYCNVCRKLFGNKNAYDNHLNSKKHKLNERDYVPYDGNDGEMESEEEEVEELDSDEWNEDAENPMDQNDCIFCLHHSRNFIKNLEHMTTSHSFFIPDIEYCVDVYGLLRYLGEKISDGFMCIWCNEKGRTFYSADAARKHMTDKGHCRMLHEGEALAEYADFYDYTASYPDTNDQLDPDEEVTVPELDNTDYQLVLPSGVSVGHRSLMRYYKQSINPNSTALVSKTSKKMHKILACYRSLGWVETNHEAAAKKAKDIHCMKRLQAKLNMKLGIKGNKLQKHYRPQVNF